MEDELLSLCRSNGDPARLCELLACGADANATDSTGWTPACWCARVGAPVLLEHLLCAGVDADAACHGSTLLHLAVRYDQPGVVAALLRHGASVQSRTDEGLTPALVACQGNSPAALSRLLAERPDVLRDVDLLSGAPSLTVAVTSKSTACLALLLDAGCDIEARDVEGRTALMRAAAAGDAAIVQPLLLAGAEVDAQASGCGRTALLFAASEGQADAVELLLRAGAGVLKPADARGRTALSVSARRVGDALVNADPAVLFLRGRNHLKVFQLCAGGLTRSCLTT